MTVSSLLKDAMRTRLRREGVNSDPVFRYSACGLESLKVNGPQLEPANPLPGEPRTASEGAWPDAVTQR